MRISVNGQELNLDGDISVQALLERFELGQAACAVEINKTLIPKRRHQGQRLADGDSVEIVTLAGGG